MNDKETRLSMEVIGPWIGEITATGRDVTFCVTGNSMNPLWRNRKNNVVLTACDKNALRRDDVPLYLRDDGKYVLHRIVRVHDGVYDMAGDAQWHIEEGIRPDQIQALLKGYYTESGKYRSCRSRYYRFYCAFWRLGFPLRRYLLALWRRTLLKGLIKKGGPADEK